MNDGTPALSGMLDEGTTADISALMSIEPLPSVEKVDYIRPSSTMLSALAALGRVSPELLLALQGAARSGSGLAVKFSPDVTKALQAGTLRLMQSGTGTLPTAVAKSGKIVEHARVVSGAANAVGGGAGVGAAGVVGAGAAGASLASVAIIALPIVIAGAAAYAQQRQLERSLKEIKEAIQRIEERLEDADSGVCMSAERFIDLVASAVDDGGFTPYLTLELAAQRTAVEALYLARRQWIDRFKADLEREQIERERDKGRGQPWVDTVADAARSGKLEKELTLYVRALLVRTKLSVLAAAVLAEEGRGSTAMKMLHDGQLELRSEFFDLHNRLRPLANIAPDSSLREKVPGLRNRTLEAHATVKALTEHLDKYVLPSIPNPHEAHEVVAALSPATVAHLALVAA